jgi:hypothetical protein
MASTKTASTGGGVPWEVTLAQLMGAIEVCECLEETVADDDLTELVTVAACRAFQLSTRRVRNSMLQAVRIFVGSYGAAATFEAPIELLAHISREFQKLPRRGDFAQLDRRVQWLIKRVELDYDRHSCGCTFAQAAREMQREARLRYVKRGALGGLERRRCLHRTLLASARSSQTGPSPGR